VKKEDVYTDIFTNHKTDTMTTQIAEARKQLGLFLKNRRTELGMSRMEAHRLTGLSRTQLIKIEDGTWNYTVDSLIRLCRALNLDQIKITSVL